jgi:CheY-like chemotaxis protein
VLSASNCQEALAQVKKKKPDAVLLDIVMPETGGLKILKKIRKFNKDLPVFIITAFSTEERFKLARDLKASGFIVKTDDLKKEISNITTFLNLADKYKQK